jgi:peptide/nickel transport system permease protein
LQAIPRLVLLLACAALWQPGIPTLVTVLALTGWMGVARLVRAEVQGLAARDFVEAARALGAPPVRVLGRHVIPNAIAPALVATTLGVGNAIMLESGLSFLGLGVQPPAPSWGNMIAAGREHLVTAPWIALAPGLAVVITVTAATLIGDWLQERLAGRLQP